MWHETGLRAEVTCIVRSPKDDTYAVGYADGSIRLWNSATASVEVTLNGHKRAVTAMAFDKEGVRLASGSMDTDLILWDVIAETGMFRCVVRSAKDRPSTDLKLGYVDIATRSRPSNFSKPPSRSKALQCLRSRRPRPPLSPDTLSLHQKTHS